MDVKNSSLKSLLKTPQTLVQNQIEIGYPSIESVEQRTKNAQTDNLSR
jgi:hypothetical protein